MTRILYLSPYFWPEEIGSAPYCTDLAAWLRDNQNDITVIAFRPHYPNMAAFTEWHDGSKDDDHLPGMPIIRVPIGGRGNGGFKERIRNDLRFFFKVIGSAVAGGLRKPDIIVAYVPSVLTLYAAFFVRLFTRARILAVVHDVESGLAMALEIVTSKTLLSAMRCVERAGLNRADHVVVLTESIKEEVRKIGCKKPISVFSIWAAPSSVEPTPIVSDGTTVVMYSGNFGKKQNLDQLVPLIERLSKERLPFKFVMRGDGSERAQMEKRLAAANVENTVFLPLVPNEELITSLQSAHLHLVPAASNVSNYAIPSKLFSIMSSGRPFISIAGNGSPVEQLVRKSGAGVFVPHGEEDALYQAVIDLSKDRKRQMEMGKKGQDYVAKHMNKEEIMHAYADLISEVAINARQ